MGAAGAKWLDEFFGRDPEEVEAKWIASTAAARRKMLEIDEQATVIFSAGDIFSEGKNFIRFGDTELYDFNGGKVFTPASALKVPLVFTAFKLLEEDFRFTTTFYKDNKGNLVIKGGGDPFLVSEEVVLIAHNLIALGHTQFRSIALDDRLFSNVKLPGIGESDNPYDAQFASLLVNFNTLNVRHRRGKLISAEEQTPTLPLLQEFASIPRSVGAQRINLAGDTKHRRAYVTQLFRAIFKQNGISFTETSGYELAKVNTRRQKPIYTHKNSRSLEDVGKQLLLYSNNLIANALLLQFAPNAKDPLKASLNAWRESYHSVLGSYDKKTLVLAEGSGLSRRNMITAYGMFRILENFKYLAHLLPSDEDGARYKTGTLLGVYTAAGYLKPHSSPLSFVVFTKKSPNVRLKLIEVLKTLD